MVSRGAFLEDGEKLYEVSYVTTKAKGSRKGETTVWLVDCATRCDDPFVVPEGFSVGEITERMSVVTPASDEVAVPA